MTENEAKEELKCYVSGTSHPEEIEIAIKALEEVQQYREIGTVEECRKNKDFLQFLSDRMPTLRTYNVLKEKGRDK